MVRGGGWGYHATFCRSAYRISYTSGYRNDHLGFRLAAALPEDLLRVKFPKLAESKPKNIKPIQWPEDAPPPAVAPFDADQAKQHQQAWADYLDLAVEKEVVLGQDADGKHVTLTMVLVPPGEFLMGSTEEEQSRFLEEAKAANDQSGMDRIPKEGPQDRVRITRPFYLGKHEVTQAQWQTMMGKNPSRFRGNPANPVEQVNWDDADTFVVNMNAMASTHQLQFSLPTEAQWECACRAGTTTIWHSGNRAEDLRQYSWFQTSSGGETHPVGQLNPNAFGLFDLHGNVFEWCRDWSARDYYARSPLNDPEGPLRGSDRVRRGGSWARSAARCRSAARGNLRAPGIRYSLVGFRVAAALPEDVRRAKLPSAAVAYALSFDGKDDYVEIPSLKHGVNSPMTVETICRIVDLNRSTLVDLGSRETSEFVLRTDARQWRFERSSGSKWISTRGAQGFKPAEFVHIAGVWDGSRLRLFINGVLQPGSNDTNKSRSRTQLERLLIGGLGQGVGNQSAPPTEFFGGMIKGLRISKTARYTSRFTAPTDFESDEQTLALYDFETGSGDVLHDVSGNGHHGKIIGATWGRDQ